MQQLEQHIEGLIFATDQPISKTDIQQCLEDVLETSLTEEKIDEALSTLVEKYKDDIFAIEIAAIGEGYQFLTKGAYHNTVGTYLKQTTRRKLSRSALETLSIIAYKQPVTKGDLEKIRGVSCDYAIQKLLEKELVAIIGRSDAPGRPLLYTTSQKFMDYFGIASLKDLPKPRDFETPDSEVGEKAPIEEQVTDSGADADS
ncbi:MAG: SMC-Scp complex subunit ScpB [Bacteroidota bacterium]